MIRHIFQIIWNERKTNVLILLEFVLIFCILWFCCDFLYFIGKRYFEPRGFDIEHTYRLSFGTKPNNILTEEEKEQSQDEFSNALKLIERVKRYPGVEAVSLSNSGIPYTPSYSGSSFAVDTAKTKNAQIKSVSDDYFDVFRIDLTQGRLFDWTDPGQNNDFVITPDYKNEFLGYPAGQVDRFYSYGAMRQKLDPDLTAVGVTQKVKMDDFEPYGNTVFQSIRRINRNYFHEVSVRVSPDVDAGFAERFFLDMRDQLNFGTRYLLSVTPLSDLRKQKNRETYNTLNGVFAVTGFLIVNIFLGVLGTFWFRTQSRRGEIGLRMALGASRRKVKGLLIGETVLLLGIAAVAGTLICLNIGQTDLLQSIGVPAINREQYGIGREQDAINFALTFVFLAVVSVLAVWYPARQASATQPAQVLHEE